MRGNRHYVHLAIMIALSFISMYILMYAMVNRFANVYSNLNQFYMAGLMTAPIVVIELALMGSARTAGFRKKKRGRAGLQSACDELIDKGAIITGE